MCVCVYVCMKNTNTVDLLLAFICCNFFRSSSHWIISFVIYIRLCPYHVGTRKLSTYTLAKSSHFNSHSLFLYLNLSLLYLIRALESLSIWIVFIRFNFVLNTFSHFSCSQTILEWKLNFEIPSFYLSQVLCILFVLCFLFRCYFIFKSPMNCLTSSSSYSSSNFVHCIYDKIPI